MALEDWIEAWTKQMVDAVTEQHKPLQKATCEFFVECLRQRILNADAVAPLTDPWSDVEAEEVHNMCMDYTDAGGRLAFAVTPPASESQRRLAQSVAMCERHLLAARDPELSPQAAIGRALTAIYSWDVARLHAWLYAVKGLTTEYHHLAIRMTRFKQALDNYGDPRVEAANALGLPGLEGEQ